MLQFKHLKMPVKQMLFTHGYSMITILSPNIYEYVQALTVLVLVSVLSFSLWFVI